MSNPINTFIEFDPQTYKNNNSDLSTIDTNYDLAKHWVNYGQSENRSYKQNNDINAEVEVKELDELFKNKFDLEINNGELSLEIGPIYKTYSTNGIIEDSEPIIKTLQVRPLLYEVPVEYPSSIPYTSNTALTFTNSFNLDITKYDNFYIELDASKYNVDSVITPVLSFTPDYPNSSLVRSYWGKTGHIFVKGVVTINKSGEINSLPKISNNSPNRYLFDVIEFNNPTNSIYRNYKYFLTSYNYKNDYKILSLFSTSLKTTNNNTDIPQDIDLILIDNNDNPNWLYGTSTYGNTFNNLSNYKENNQSRDYRSIESVSFNSINKSSSSNTTYTNPTLNNFYYDDVTRTVTEETGWWIYFDNKLDNSIPANKAPSYSNIHNTNLKDTIDVVYGISDSTNRALWISIKNYLSNNAELLTLSGGNLSNIEVLQTDNSSGTIKFKNFIQLSSDDVESDITVKLLNDIDDLSNWGITGDGNKFNQVSKSFLNITVSFIIDSDPIEDNEYKIWGKNIKLNRIENITLDTYTSYNNKTTISLSTYPVYYCEFTRANNTKEKWYVTPTPLFAQNVSPNATEISSLYSKKPFQYTAKLYAYIYNILPYSFNIPSLLLSSNNRYLNDNTVLDSSINSSFENILFSQISYENNFIGNTVSSGNNVGAIDLISLINKTTGTIIETNTITYNSTLINPVYTDPIYDYVTYNIPDSAKINILVSYNYTIVPLLTSTNTIVSLKQIYKHYSVTL